MNKDIFFEKLEKLFDEYNVNCVGLGIDYPEPQIHFKDYTSYEFKYRNHIISYKDVTDPEYLAYMKTKTLSEKKYE